MQFVDYGYVLEYEICALIFLCCLSFQFFSSKRFKTPCNRIFAAILLLCIADLALDVAGCITVAKIDELPAWVNGLVNGLFYAMQAIMPALMCTYVVHVLRLSYKQGQLKLILIPSMLLLVFIATNPFTGLMFSLPVIDGVRRFAHGPLFYGLYLSSFFYLVVVLVMVARHRQRITPRQITTILFFVVISTVAVIFQFINPNILMTGTAMTISIILWDLTLQNPDDMLDELSGAFDASALKLYLEAEMLHEKINAAVVEIAGLNSSERYSGDNTPALLAQNIGAFFSKLDSHRHTWYFRESMTRFWILARDAGEINRIANQITERFSRTWELGDFELDLIAKVLCVSTNTSMRISPSEFISIINEALSREYVIDNQQPRRLTIDSELLARYRRRQIIEESMRHAVKSKRGFYLCFQPIISLKNESRNAAEVLLRYSDPNLGAVSPAEFMPIIEQCGLAMYIDTFVADRAADFLSRHPEIDLLHVNFSATEFFHNPVDRITKIVNSHNVDPKRLCFEITETSAARNPEMLRLFMNQMIEKGYEFALDDYGTGYSNANQVLSMPFKVVKIDRIFLSDSQKNHVLLSGTIRMFQELGLTPVVEGVETMAQLNRVKELGISNIQGFLFSVPLVEEDYIAYVKSS